MRQQRQTDTQQPRSPEAEVRLDPAVAVKCIPALHSLGVFVRDMSGGSSAANRLWRDLGYSDDELRGEDWMTLVHPDDLPTVRHLYQLTCRGEDEGNSAEFRFRAKDGSWRWVHCAIAVVERDCDGRLALYVGRELDITQRKELEIALANATEDAKQRARESETLRQIGVILSSTTDPQQAVATALERAQRVIPHRSAAVFVVRDGETKLVAGNDQPADISIPLITHGEEIGLLSVHATDEHPLNQQQMVVLRAFADQLAVALHAALLLEQTRQLAMTDSLTGLPTRRAFELQAPQRIALAARTDKHISALMIDIDHFKQLNDSSGHAAGDRVLNQLGTALCASLRESDLACRYGGDEFAVLLPGTGAAEARAIAERLRSTAQHAATTERPVTLSIGVVTVPAQQRCPVNDMLAAADNGLYRAKRGGRDRVAPAQD
ncbi:MAG: GGDEF domain-containing protein [Spirochaetaceae bacterium]|nr:MAG: GGDEF domain-containing protein [Spirochaetaceae bacterium]